MTKNVLLLSACALLASCGKHENPRDTHGGKTAPAELIGTWAENCAEPVLKIDAAAIHVLRPLAEDDKLLDSQYDGTTWKATYMSMDRKVTKVFNFSNNTLRADLLLANGYNFDADKIPLKKCG